MKVVLADETIFSFLMKHFSVFFHMNVLRNYVSPT
uniref:Uncharacterized protein n=1 Tax=Anguilla anguilla TaxID=7936 RepID=A0A0E9RLE6_ANGAN